MNDLESLVARWRRDMLAAGMKSPVPLEELESHLRDDIEAQMRAGVETAQAFNAAVQRLGTARGLMAEFGGVRPMRSHSRIHAVLLVALGVQLAVTAGMFLWLSQISASAGPVGLPRTPEWMLPWHGALGVVYVMFITATLWMRRAQPALGRRMMRWLNWALLLVLPFGTLTGLYGLWITRNDRHAHPTPAVS